MRSGTLFETAGRIWFALTALVVLGALILQAYVSATGEASHFHTVAGRLFNLLCYFTILSNIMVGTTCLIAALRPNISSTGFSVFRLAAITGIAITFVVYHTLLSSLWEPEGHAAVADMLLHTVVPAMALAGWIVFGPRGLTSAHVVGLALLVPLVWAVFTLIRGPIVDYYPYPFLDVRDHGYARVFLNMGIVAALFLIVAGGATVLDRRLGRLRGGVQEAV